MLQPIVYPLVGLEQNGRNLAVFTGPVKENFLILLPEMIRSVRLFEYRRFTQQEGLAEQKTFQPLCAEGFVDSPIPKILLIQVNISWSRAKYRLDDIIAGLDGPTDLSRQQARLFQ